MGTLERFGNDVYPFVIVFILIGFVMTYLKIRKDRKEMDKDRSE